MIDNLLKFTKAENWPEVSELLYRHWVRTSQTVYPAHLEKPWEDAADENKIVNELLYPLSAMFCAESSAPILPNEQNEPLDCSLHKLKEIVDIDETVTRSGQICGRVFKNGEPNYSCKECATDSTCVLCYDCFVNSAHINHKYKTFYMHTSLGSGYCDCGDKEAWSSNYACKLHMPKEGEKEEMETGYSCGLPQHVANRLHHLSLITLKFAVNLLCWDGTMEFPSIIKPEWVNTEHEYFQTILFNDETHTYDGVIRALELAIACSSANAMRLATIVDREGRSIVRTGSRESCENVKQAIENRTKKESNRRTQKSGPLGVKIYYSTLSALQSLAVRLLQWISTQAQEFPPLGPFVSESLLYGCSECDYQIPGLGQSSSRDQLERICTCESKSLVCLLMLFDRRLWKAARTAFHKLLMATILMDMEHKYLFGRLLVQNYPIIFDDFIEDDHEHSVSITSMTVQIFTVPTIARRLIIEEDAIYVCMEKLRDRCQRYITTSSHNNQLYQMDFTNDPYPAVLKRALYILNDIGYLLILAPKETEWTDEFRQKFVHGSDSFLHFLSDMQNMDEVKRQAVEHQLMESEWETAFNIFLRLQETISLLLVWARTDPAVHSQLFQLALKSITQKTMVMPEFGKERVKVEVNGHSAYCIPFEVARQPISVHQPLWRFVGGLFCASDTILRNYTVNETHQEFLLSPNSKEIPILSDKPANLKGVRTMLMEMPLRVLVLNAQAGAAQLWRRNGFSLVNQIHNYSSNLCRTEMFDRDIHLLQAIGAKMDPNKFLIRILDRFSLAKWAEIGFEDKTPTFTIDGATQEESSKLFTVVAEEMLHLFIILFGERYTVGLSNEATPQKILEQEIIHLLCTGPKPFSYIEKYVPNDPAIQRLSLQNAVRNVGDFKRPTNISSGNFHLKESLRTEFNPFFWHYSKHQASLAEQQQNKERANMSRDLKACPPPIPPRFTQFFTPLLKIMESEVFIKLIRVIVERMSKRSRFVSDGLFYRALFLLGMSLNEQKRAYEDGNEFKFLHMARIEGLFGTLERIFEKSEVETHNDLLWWVIKTYKHVESLYSKTKAAEVHLKELVHKERESTSTQRAALAARKRQLAMDRMRQLQNSFRNQNINLLDSSSNEQSSSAAVIGAAAAIEMEIDDHDEPAILPAGAGFPVCCGVSKSIVLMRPQPMVMCILCQEDEIISFDGNPIMCSAFVQSSNQFSTDCAEMREEIGRGENLNIFTSIDLPSELHVSTCSHLMHFSCYTSFLDSMNARERTRYRPHMLNSRMLNTESGEYLCPLCKRLSNCVIPVYPPPVQTLENLKGFSEDCPKVALETSFDEWVATMSALVMQPFSPLKQNKGHSRKRSHSERSLAELAKNAATASQTASSMREMTTAGIVGSLPSSFEAIPLPGPDATSTPILEEQATQSSSTSFSSISDAITGQIQAIEHNMLNESSAAIVQQLLTYVFGGGNGRKSFSHKDISQTNVPSFISNWKTLKPLFTIMDRIRTNEKDSPQLFRMESFSRFSETLNILKSCSFLVRSITAVLETEKKPLFGAFNTRQRDCLNAIVRLAQLIPFNCQPSGLRVLLSRLLSPLLAPPYEDKPANKPVEQQNRLRRTLSPINLQSSSTTEQSLDQVLRSEAGIMQIDMLTLAVELVFCIGWNWSNGKRALHNMADADAIYKVADGSIDELYAMQLTLLANLFQTIVAFEPPEYPFFDDKDLFNRDFLTPPKKQSKELEEEVNENETIDFNQVMERIRELFPNRRWRFNRKNELHLYNQLHIATVAFLRPMAILYNTITLVPPPESLKDPSLDIFNPLCRYLGLPCTLLELLSGPEVDRLFQMWNQHTIPTELSIRLTQIPLKFNQLIELPEDFSQLINKAVNFSCPEVREVTSATPTLCLSCGELLCSQNYCCQKQIKGQTVGACTYHLTKCNSSTGIFLRIRECQIFFLYVSEGVSRGCFKAAPYVDEFGETDPGFRRGNPMKLNSELYWKIRRQWIHQEVAEEIINQYELNHRNMVFEWQHF